MKPIIDCHLHTKYSPDGCETPENMIIRAVAMGLKNICLTDHMDELYCDPTVENFDRATYRNELYALKERYKGIIDVNVGIEAGWTEKNNAINEQVFKEFSFDYVINSIHEVNGRDFYHAASYSGQTRESAYREYFTAVLDSLKVSYRYDAVGHLGYVVRNAPYENKLIADGEFSDILNEIFKIMIAREAILELNTSVCSAPTPTIPNPEIIKMYRRAGGKLITFSSDAHNVGRIGYGYEQAAIAAIDCGFDRWTAVSNGKKIFFPIE